MLGAAGIERVYGVSGASLRPVAEAVRTSNDVTWVPFACEASAVSAAAAEVELTGRVAVCVGRSGSGNVRLLDRLYAAHRNRRPLLAIAMYASTREIGHADDELHPEQLLRHCSSVCELVSHSHQMPRLLRRAVAAARPGVSVLVLPADVALRGATVTEPRDVLRPVVSATTIAEHDLREGEPLAQSRHAVQRLAASYSVEADGDTARSGLARLLSIITAHRPHSIVVCSPATGLAEAVGVHACVSRPAGETASAIDRAVARQGPSLIEIVDD